MKGKSISSGIQEKEMQKPSGGERGAEDEKNKNNNKKKLYVFFWHAMGCKYCHSLYAIDVPSKIPINTAETFEHSEPVVPERIWVDPVLRFPSKDWKQRIMTCAGLNSKLYFLGGEVGHFLDYIEYPPDVYILDLSSSADAASRLSLHRDEPRNILEKGPRMLTGKVSPVISFVADGKIFVVSSRKSCPFTGKRLEQFEIFDPAEGEWKSGKACCFAEDLNDIGPFVVAGRQVIVLASRWRTQYIYSYDLDTGTWSEFDASGWTKMTRFRSFGFNNGSQYIGDAIYSMHSHATTKLPVVVAIEHLGEEKLEEDLLLDNKKIFHVVKHKISSPGLSGALALVGDRQLCFVEVGAPMDPSANPNCFNSKECFMSVTLFHVTGDGKAAEYINCAHYAMFPDESPFSLLSAHPI